MKREASETRAMWAFMSLCIALFVGADAFGNRNTADYYHDRALGFFVLFISIWLLLTIYNAIQARRNKR
jgi:hypothetical protein